MRNFFYLQLSNENLYFNKFGGTMSYSTSLIESPRLNVNDNSNVTASQLKKIQLLISEERQSSQKEAFQKLEDAFSELLALDPNKSVYLSLFISTIGRYGIRLYPKFEAALPYLLASLQWQLNLLTQEDFKLISNLTQIEKNPWPIEQLIEFIKTTDEKNYPDLLKNLSHEEKIHFADTLLHAGYVYSNLKETYLKMERKPFLDFLTHLYGGVREILLSLEQNQDIQEKLGELQYNIHPGLYLNRCELDGEITKEQMLTSFEILDKAAEYNPTLQMKARIANLKACRIYDYDLLAAKEFSTQSLQIWREVLKDPQLTAFQNEKYGQLYANANSAYMAILMEIQKQHGSQELNLEELNHHANIVRETYSKVREMYPYSMILGLNLARIEMLKKNPEGASQYLDEIQTMSKHYQNWPDTQGLLKKVEELRQKIVTNSF